MNHKIPPKHCTCRRSGRAVDHLAGTPLKNFTPAYPIIRTETQPGSEVLFCVPAAHIDSNFGNDRLYGLDIQATHFRQVDSGDPVKMVSQVESWPVLS